MRLKPISYICLCLSISHSVICYAEEASVKPEPYVLSQSINTIPIAKDLAIATIRRAKEIGNQPSESEDLTSQIQDLEAQLKASQLHFDQLNQVIADYEGEGDQSLTFLAQVVDTIIEQAYNYLVNSRSDFLLLDEEEQASLLQTNEDVMAAQANYEAALATYQQLITERQTITTQYEQMKYDLELLYGKQNQGQDDKLLLNQSLLYPYSMPYLSVDHLLLNQDETHLSQYLLKLDNYLSQLVPSAYYQLKFEDMYQAFLLSNHSEEAVNQALTGKHPFVLDETGKTYYTYARELNLFDVTVYANFALSTYYSNQNEAALKTAYQTLIQMKDQQCQYFYAINQEAFDYIKTQLTTYLNQTGQVDETARIAIDQIQEKYQIELVQLNLATHQWEAIEQAASGKLEAYLQQDLWQNEAPLAPDTSITTQTSESMTAAANDKLAHLKQKLAQTQPKLDKTNKSLSAPNRTQEGTAKANSTTKLPTTGEQRRIWWLAIGLLISGLILLGFNLYRRYQRKQELSKIKLD